MHEQTGLDAWTINRHVDAVGLLGRWIDRGWNPEDLYAIDGAAGWLYFGLLSEHHHSQRIPRFGVGGLTLCGTGGEQDGHRLHGLLFDSGKYQL